MAYIISMISEGGQTLRTAMDAVSGVKGVLVHDRDQLAEAIPENLGIDLLILEGATAPIAEAVLHDYVGSQDKKDISIITFSTRQSEYGIQHLKDNGMNIVGHIPYTSLSQKVLVPVISSYLDKYLKGRDVNPDEFQSEIDRVIRPDWSIDQRSGFLCPTAP